MCSKIKGEREAKMRKNYSLDLEWPFNHLFLKRPYEKLFFSIHFSIKPNSKSTGILIPTVGPLWV